MLEKDELFWHKLMGYVGAVLGILIGFIITAKTTVIEEVDDDTSED